MKNALALIPALVLFTYASSLLADGNESCSAECPTGQVQVSFADGNSARCICQDPGSPMEETPSGEIACSDPEDDGSCE